MSPSQLLPESSHARCSPRLHPQDELQAELVPLLNKALAAAVAVLSKERAYNVSVVPSGCCWLCLRGRLQGVCEHAPASKAWDASSALLPCGAPSFAPSHPNFPLGAMPGVFGARSAT